VIYLRGLILITECEAITGDCSACISSSTPSCKWCADGCAYNCATELEMTTCPSLTSVDPDHSHINGNELITVVGGPFFSRSGFNYECRFGTRRALATVVDGNTIQCQSPPIISAATVNVTVWLNGKNYAPFSSLAFTYFSKFWNRTIPRIDFLPTACSSVSETVCSSSCSSQQYCGWCSSTSTCTASNLCNAVDDMFLPQCLGKILSNPLTL
jgi:hypothetical protein